MEDPVRAVLSGWSDFYVIIGSASAALTGLMFIAITLISERARSSDEQIAAFGTPNIVHFVAPIVLAGILTAPWRELDHLALALKLSGGAGVVYAVIAIWRAYRQTGYRPVLSDWIWFSFLPLVAYVALTASAFMLRAHFEDALFGTAAVALFLLVIAIHNAWDTATYVAISRRERDRARNEGEHSKQVR